MPRVVVICPRCKGRQTMHLEKDEIKETGMRFIPPNLLKGGPLRTPEYEDSAPCADCTTDEEWKRL